MEDLMKIDLYELLNISISADEKEIKKAYRRKALTYHPDKNPDNPKAVERFQLLSKAVEKLTDAAARSEYDKVLNARKAAQVRHRELDSKRKKFKEDLEAREKFEKEKDSARNLQREREKLRNETVKLIEEENERSRKLMEKFRNEEVKLIEEQNEWLRQQIEKEKLDLEATEKFAREFQEKDSAEKLQKELERLRKEGSKLLEEENELLRQQIEKEKLGFNKTESHSLPRLKVKWKSHKNDDDNGGYSQKSLDSIFQKYGQVTCLVSSKKKGSAIIEFLTPEAAQQAFETERGNSENPLTLSWISGQPEIPRNSPLNSTRSHQPTPELGDDTVLTSRDYESLVLMKMRQAEERKRLIQQMMEEEDQ